MSEIVVGANARSVKKVDRELIRQFAAVSGDVNPIHLDDAYAQNSPFGEIIAPGLLVGSFISALIANELPGPGSIYLSQKLTFVRPVYIDDLVETTIEVINIPKSVIYELRTQCMTERSGLVIDGTAVVKFSGRE